MLSLNTPQIQSILPQWPKPTNDDTKQIIAYLKQILNKMYPKKLTDVFIIGFNQVTLALQRGDVQAVINVSHRQMYEHIPLFSSLYNIPIIPITTTSCDLGSLFGFKTITMLAIRNQPCATNESTPAPLLRDTNQSDKTNTELQHTARVLDDDNTSIYTKIQPDVDHLKTTYGHHFHFDWITESRESILHQLQQTRSHRQTQLHGPRKRPLHEAPSQTSSSSDHHHHDQSSSACYKKGRSDLGSLPDHDPRKEHSHIDPSQPQIYDATKPHSNKGTTPPHIQTSKTSQMERIPPSPNQSEPAHVASSCPTGTTTISCTDEPKPTSNKKKRQANLPQGKGQSQNTPGSRSSGGDTSAIVQLPSTTTMAAPTPTTTASAPATAHNPFMSAMQPLVDLGGKKPKGKNKGKRK